MECSVAIERPRVVSRKKRAGAAGDGAEVFSAVSLVERAALRADEVREEREHSYQLSAFSGQLKHG
jgi:hypothetical protein